MKLANRLIPAMPAILATTILALPAAASSESVLYDFLKGHGNPSTPLSHLFLVGNDLLYGTTEKGGTYKFGTVFQLQKDKFGNWHETTLYNFEGRNLGGYPKSGVSEDAAGNLYGTTEVGGTHNDGIVYQLSNSGGKWHERTIYNFAGGNDGSHPYAELKVDRTTGIIYGTTYNGGGSNCGVVFSLTPSGSSWVEAVLTTLQNAGGCNSQAGLREDSFGDLYGTSVTGGEYGYGEVFQLVPANGAWTVTVLHSFGSGSDGRYGGELDLDPAGTLYGTNYAGGNNNNGSIYELAQSGGTWVETVLYQFRGSPDGSEPYAMRYNTSTGALVGVTEFGGSSNEGTVFQLTPSGSSWRETVLHSFSGAPADGAFPQSSVTIAPKTNKLYGVTVEGGTDNIGVVYSVQP